jgi:predicted TIM-barrel fold metal-dependent hydrolase
MIVEWNAHMFSGDTQRFPFHPQAVYTPAVAGLAADPLLAYRARLERAGIDRAVIVQPEPYRDDHRVVLDCLAREPRLKGTALFLPTDPDAVAMLSAFVAAHPRIIAQRFHAHRGKEMYLDSFYDAAVRALWQRAGELGLVIELHIGPNYARQVADLLREFPTFPVLIDHLAEPGLGTAEEYEEVLALGQFPNAIMKLSGLGHFSREAEPYLDAKPLVQRVAAAFGPERLVWSSGSPAIVDALLDPWPAEARALVKGGTLARLAGFAA